MKLILSILLILLTNLSMAQTSSRKETVLISNGSPESVGISSIRLQRLDKMCLEAILKNEIPGISYLVLRKGKIVAQKAYGMANNSLGKKLKTNSIFRIASQTKAITSTALMMLWEEGKFQLDDPISKYIPAFKNPVVLDSLLPNGQWITHPAKNEITIRNLLSHTSGIGYGAIGLDDRIKKIYQKAGIIDLATTKNISIEENVLKLATLPLIHEPGTDFTYSEGLDVVGYLIESLSGVPLDEFYNKHIFEPLGMKDTYFYLPDAKKDRLVTVQIKENGSWIPLATTFYDPDYPIKGAKRFFSGGAGLSSTMMDYAIFLQMYLNKGVYNGVRLLSRTTVDFMLTNQVHDFIHDTGIDYGLAFGLNNEVGHRNGGKGSIESFEWGGYFNTSYFVDPQEELIGIMMKQTMDATDDSTLWKFRPLVLQSIDD